jgi:hypothetical protein
VAAVLTGGGATSSAGRPVHGLGRAEPGGSSHVLDGGGVLTRRRQGASEADRLDVVGRVAPTSASRSRPNACCAPSRRPKRRSDGTPAQPGGRRASCSPPSSASPVIRGTPSGRPGSPPPRPGCPMGTYTATSPPTSPARPCRRSEKPSTGSRRATAPAAVVACVTGGPIARISARPDPALSQQVARELRVTQWWSDHPRKRSRAVPDLTGYGP